MSAIVCGKRAVFEDLASSSPPVVSKRIRCSSSSSPIRYSPPRPSLLIEHLRAIFPDMDSQLLEKALEECGDDLDSAIRSLNELRLGSLDRNLGAATGKLDPTMVENDDIQPQGEATTNEGAGSVGDPAASNNFPMDGAEWVELFVREMMSASNVDNARARASRALEVLEKSICVRASEEAARNFQQENIMLKEQLQALIQENAILKRAVTIQHERQKEFEERGQEIQHLKQLVSQYQEQLRTMEVNNYALAMHLKQAQQKNSLSGRFHPDVF